MIRVRNVSKAELIFVGGHLLPDEEKVFPNELALKLIKRNPKMLIGTLEEVKVEETRPQMKTRRKRK